MLGQSPSCPAFPDSSATHPRYASARASRPSTGRTEPEQSRHATQGRFDARHLLALHFPEHRREDKLANLTGPLNIHRQGLECARPPRWRESTDAVEWHLQANAHPPAAPDRPSINQPAQPAHRAPPRQSLARCQARSNPHAPAGEASTSETGISCKAPTTVNPLTPQTAIRTPGLNLKLQRLATQSHTVMCHCRSAIERNGCQASS